MVGLHFQLIQHLHKVLVVDKHDILLTVKWLTRVASLHFVAPDRSVMLPKVAGCGPCVSVIGLHFQLIQHLHKVLVVDKHEVSLTVKWLTRVASLHIVVHGRSVMLPKVAGYGPYVSAPSPIEDTCEKNNKKSVTICTVTKDVETNMLNSYICPYSFTPLSTKA